MERLFSLLFALAIAGVGLGLDYYGARQVTPGLSLGDHIADRVALLTGSGTGGEAVVQVSKDPGSGPGAGPGAAQVLAMALGALRAAGGRPAETGASGDPAAIPSPAQTAQPSAAALAAEAARAFGEVSQALTEGAPPGGTAAAPPAPKPSILKVSGGLSGGSCATKAGTKFCSAARTAGD